ncbi:hypothetical protein [Paenibacillus wulumuqiensis]|uniref:hypothetical protein n=1 Tax=Paenibacillus wulumuqiensis TaxID=1567107 RepID=UPI00061960D3|nr:hypothetical protein [Paenibacillus wulumuqiensis]
MRYFQLSGDDRIPNTIKPPAWSILQQREILSSLSLPGRELPPLTIHVHEDDYTIYPDMLNIPAPLVSDSLKQLLEKFLPNKGWRAVMLSDIDRGRQHLYWLLQPDVVEARSVQSIFRPDGTLEQLVLHHEKIQQPIFRVAGLREPYVYINLAAAESLLRRSYTGIRLIRIPTVRAE